jgi:hypothetical protein
MKIHPHFPVTVLAAAVLFGAMPLFSASPFTTADITRVYNEVRILQEDGPPAAASIGDIVQGETRVVTGIESRAELRFPDKSLTRMGANTVFQLQAGSRTMELEQGVILLQVPKRMGGAKVRTAAVTAAVSGTTILVEYMPGGYIKIIVVEGELDLFFNDKPANFITMQQGDMIIMRTDATIFPLPVKVDLKRLIATSRLMDPEIFGELGNQREFEQALNEQANLKDKGELIQTAFIIEGLGTRVAFTQELRQQLERGFPESEGTVTPLVPVGRRSPPDPGLPSDPAPPETQPPEMEDPEIIPPTTYVDDNTFISTNPSIDAFNDPGGFIEDSGLIYNPGNDGPVREFLFGSPPGPQETQQFIADRGAWSVFTFFDLVIAGNPDIDSSNGPRNLMLASQSGVNFSDETVFPELSTSNLLILDDSLDALAVLSEFGNIVINPGFSIFGWEGGQSLLLDAYGPDSDLLIYGIQEEDSALSIDLFDGVVQTNAGRDVMLDRASIYSGQVGLLAGRDVGIANSSISAGQSVEAAAGRNLDIVDSTIQVDSVEQGQQLGEPVIEVTSSSELVALAQADVGQLFLIAENGNVTVNQSFLDAPEVQIESQTGNVSLLSDTFIQAEIIKARTHSANGILTIGGNSQLNATDLIRLYAEGANGRIQFTGPATLDASRIDLAGATVRVNAGVDVNVPQNTQFRVYTDNPEFSNNNPGNGFGRFTRDNEPFSVQGGAFGERPAY